MSLIIIFVKKYRAKKHCVKNICVIKAHYAKVTNCWILSNEPNALINVPYSMGKIKSNYLISFFYAGSLEQHDSQKGNYFKEI